MSEQQTAVVEQKTVHLVFTRQDNPDTKPYKEEFHVPYRKNMNIISAMMEIQRNPVNANGEIVAPIQWESSCLEEVCGACSMVINGKPRQACTALVDKLEQPIRIDPMRTFPVIRDLVINRGRMFEALKKVKAWIPVDGTHDLGPGPRQSALEQQWNYELSKCMTCGVCLEACPNVNDNSAFIGPFAVAQVALFNAHPTGSLNKNERTEALISDGGLQQCGNSQNCVQACPKGIPLTTAIAVMNRESTVHMFKKWLSF
jgi:succinate dehydrogenase / fumarate reductase, iron-sulfur subunit